MCEQQTNKKETEHESWEGPIFLMDLQIRTMFGLGWVGLLRLVVQIFGGGKECKTRVCKVGMLYGKL